MQSWRLYTKPVRIGNGVALRWHWHLDGHTESPQGFSTREACEADALANGCIPAEQQATQYGGWLVAEA